MAIYRSLCLPYGGGILSRGQQADQARNTATVLIGLGGTGIDALRAVKTQVHQHLQPDDPDAARPEYAHIRFLGIDTEEDSAGFRQEGNDCTANNDLLPLDHSEFFSIAVPNVDRIFCHPEMLSLRPELSWLYQGGIGVPPSRVSSGSVRQVGRFMMMEHSAALAARLEQELQLARQDLRSPEIHVHILTGLCGGTGSGCFLDVCYLVRAILRERAPSAILSGYFYLPDVSLDRVPRSNSALCRYSPQNGCAALRELDYCMGFPGNGGGFTQEYQGGRRVDWKEPPVDLCFLLGASDEQGNAFPNAYRHAIDVTAEYLLTLLADGSPFSLQSYIASRCVYFAQLENAFPDCGSIRYCTLGGTAAEIPCREINTYLASRLFTQFSSIQQNFPTQADVEALAVQAFARDAQSVSGIYESLLRELRENAGDDYAAYQDDWKFVRDRGSSGLVTSYTNQTAAKLHRVEANAQRMMAAANQDSLLGRLRSELEWVTRDIRRGPLFAQRLLSAAQDHNLLNLIDRLLQENHARWKQEAAQTDRRTRDYDDAKSDFDNRRKRKRMGDSDAKRFNDYEYYLMLLEQHKLARIVYDRMNTVLTALRRQVEGINDSYYAKLARVMDNLIETFRENRAALAVPEVLHGTDSFAAPMMTLAELDPLLDAAAAQLNIPRLLDAFMAKLLDNEEVWIEEDENRITRLVTDFFVHTAFPGFANRTITAFLQDKYSTTDTAQLASHVYHDWILPLTRRARPLFPFDPTVWPAGRTAQLASLSIPASSAPIAAAANGALPHWMPRASASPDRIAATEILAGFPIRAHRDCENWERAYCGGFVSAGLHSYEGKPIPGMPLDDWRRLPPLAPQPGGAEDA